MRVAWRAWLAAVQLPSAPGAVPEGFLDSSRVTPVAGSAPQSRERICLRLRLHFWLRLAGDPAELLDAVGWWDTRDVGMA
jgi:hypothetical protein